MLEKMLCTCPPQFLSLLGEKNTTKNYTNRETSNAGKQTGKLPPYPRPQDYSEIKVREEHEWVIQYSR